MVSKYRDILEPPVELQIHRNSSPVIHRSTPTQGRYRSAKRAKRYNEGGWDYLFGLSSFMILLWFRTFLVSGALVYKHRSGSASFASYYKFRCLHGHAFFFMPTQVGRSDKRFPLAGLTSPSPLAKAAPIAHDTYVCV
uniref:Uncharacterized protein n=1 Tax=Anopheles maculatus TaxID=74869 RepID=A0A182STC5_9DIPT